MNLAYSTAITVTGGFGVNNFIVVAGGLPPGVNLNGATGALSGNPTTAGTYLFSIRDTDSYNDQATSALITIVINGPLTITTTSLPTVVTNAAYNQPVNATGGITPYTWSLFSGTPPSGLTLDSSTGRITGTPTLAGTSNFTVKVSDSGSSATTQPLSITVLDSLIINTTSLGGAKQGTAYSAPLSATGGAGNYTWSISAGTFTQAGLTLNASTGAIGGTPNTFGQLRFTVRLNDTSGASATHDFTLQINPQTADPFSVAIADPEAGQIFITSATGSTAPFCTECGADNIASDAAGNVYWHNGSGVYKVTPNGSVNRIVSLDSDNGALAADPSGNIVFVDNFVHNSQINLYSVAAGSSNAIPFGAVQWHSATSRPMST